jgi:hypothetical protein
LPLRACPEGSVLACQGKHDWTVVDGGASKSEADPAKLGALLLLRSTLDLTWGRDFHAEAIVSVGLQDAVESGEMSLRMDAFAVGRRACKPENPTGVDTGQAKPIGNYGPVAHEAPGLDEKAVRIDCRETSARHHRSILAEAEGIYREIGRAHDNESRRALFQCSIGVG